MKILIDAMGGDNAPLEVIKGAVEARDSFSSEDIRLTLVGNEKIINTMCNENTIDLHDIEILNANEVIGMDDPPLSVRTKPNSSLKVGFDALQNGSFDAMVSAGSTGAVHTGATLFVGKIPGVRRAAIGTLLPLQNPTLLIDSGANTVLNPDHMVQFALMGNVYMKEILLLENPRIGLLNIGTEPNKGQKLQKQTYAALSGIKELNFVGNVEANAAACGACDVIVTDGFTGNVFLKLTEGAGKFIFGKLKNIFAENLSTKIAYFLLKNKLRDMKKSFDAGETGGAPLFGINKPVIKAHGNSDAKAIKNAVLMAIKCVRCDINGKIQSECEKYTCSDDQD